MKKNDIIKVSVKRPIVEPGINYWNVNEVPVEHKTFDLVVDSVTPSTIKGHYLNDSDRKVYEVFPHYDIDGTGANEKLVMRVEIDKNGNVYEYKIDPNREADYYVCEKLIADAKKAHLKKYSREWWHFMGRGMLTIAEPTTHYYTGSKLSDGSLVD